MNWTGLKIMVAGLVLIATGVGVAAWADQQQDNRDYQEAVRHRAEREAALMALVKRPARPAVGVTATYYGDAYRGRLTAAGAHKAEAVPQRLWRFDPSEMTFACNAGEFGEVWAFEVNGRYLEATLTDRMKDGTPPDRVDLSREAFRQLEDLRVGKMRVYVRKVAP